MDRLDESPRPQIALWLANLLPPIAALAHVHFSFVLGNIACSTGTKWELHALSLFLLAVNVFAGLVARNEWMKPDAIDSRRLLALLGMIGAFIFGLFILAQWFPVFVLPGCVRT